MGHCYEDCGLQASMDGLTEVAHIDGRTKGAGPIILWSPA